MNHKLNDKVIYKFFCYEIKVIMCGTNMIIFIILLITLYLFIVWFEQTKTPCILLYNDLNESMAPLSVFDHTDNVSYILQPPRKYMSHDIRGDPLRIPQMQFPWLNSEIPMYEAVPLYYGELLGKN